MCSHHQIHLCGFGGLMKKLVAVIFFAMLAGNVMAQAGGASSGAGSAGASGAAGAGAGTVATVAAAVGGVAAATANHSTSHSAGCRPSTRGSLPGTSRQGYV